jgi:hypothetical protein
MAKQADRDTTVLECYAFARVGELLILCAQGEGEATPRDFEAWIERLGTNDFTKLLIHDRGARPNAKQRARIAEFWRMSGRPSPKTVLLTDSAVARYILTALEWLLNSPTKAMPIDHVDQALAWLEFKGAPAQVEFLIRDMQEALSRKQKQHGITPRV